MKSRFLAGAIMLTLIAGAAQAADTVRAQVVRAGGYVRLNFIWPDADAEAALSAEASVSNQVLLVRFSREVALDVGPILNDADAEVALARLDPDQRTLRVALDVPARTHVSRSYNVLAVDILPPEAADPADVVSPRAAAELEAAQRAAMEAAEAAANAPVPETPPLERLAVRRATSPALDRIMFDWTEATEYSLQQQDGAWTLTFSRDAEPDLAAIRADLPARLRSIEARHVDGQLQIRFVPAPGASPRALRERNTIILDLSDSETGDAALLAQLQALVEETEAGAQEAPAEEAPAEVDTAELADAGDEDAAPPAAEPEHGPETAEEHAPAPTMEAEDAEAAAPAAVAERINPVPESGVVAARGSVLGSDLMIEFPWAGPVKAAAFRRAGAIWIVFDAQAALDVSEIERGQRHVTDIQTLQGAGYSAVRIVAPATTQISLQAVGAEGRDWSFVLAEQAARAPGPIRVDRRAGEDAASAVFAALPGAADPVRIFDPGVGDTMIVAAAPGPALGMVERRDFLGFSLLPSAHGLAVETLSDALTARAEGDGVLIAPPEGGAPAAGAPLAVAAGASLAQVQFVHDERALDFENGEAAIEREVAQGDLPEAHMAMAGFLLARELAPEALGSLSLALERDPQLATRPEFRAARGVAYALAGRMREADNDLSVLALENDAAAQVWRGWISAQDGDWIQARRFFTAGEAAIGGFSTQWRARFRDAYARTALALNDLSAAKAQIDMAGVEAADEQTALRIALASARWREAAGQPEDALAAYEALARSGDEEIEARALLAGARLQHQLGRSGPAELIEALEGLRWRWRGDDVELETIRTLGELYVAEGRDREGLETMRDAVARFPEHPVSRQIFTDMMAIFNGLFLEGGADRLDPVEALALFNQFRNELTPIGSEGDRMVRRMAERQVAFDLLPQAAELLQHQVDNRLHEPRAKAEVAADLALIYLMDRQPEAALRTLRATRLTQLPPALAEERRIIEARALAELDADGAALDLIAGDPSIEAARLRADIAWKQRDWPLAGQRLEDMLGERWSAPGPIAAEDSAAALRAAVAYSLARDTDGLGRLAQRYGPLMGATADAAAFSAVTQELETSGLRLAEIAQRAADTTALEAFLERRRDHLEGDGAPAAAIAPQAAPADAQPQADAGVEGGAG